MSSVELLLPRLVQISSDSTRLPSSKAHWMKSAGSFFMQLLIDGSSINAHQDFTVMQSIADANPIIHMPSRFFDEPANTTIATLENGVSSITWLHTEPHIWTPRLNQTVHSKNTVDELAKSERCKTVIYIRSS